MYDDGYNRKKNKKKKKKQSGGKEKKSKREANKIINTQNVDIIKVEIKTEDISTEEVSTFEDISQENSDELPVIQGSYNDDIIIQNDPMEDPLKIDFSEVIDKSAKKRKKHLSHNGQKKIRLKPPSSKSKYKHNIPLYTGTSTLDASVQIRNMALPDLHGIHPTVKDTSNNQRKINALPGNMILFGNERSMTNVQDKIVNTINSQIPINYIHSDDKDNIAISIDSSKDIKSDPYKVIYPRKFGATTQNNSGHQNESTKNVPHMKQPTHVNCNITAISTKHNTNNMKRDLIKAPRLNILPMKLPQLENTAASQKSLLRTVIGPSVPNIAISPESKPIFSSDDMATIYPNVSFNNNPPILENELEAQHNGNDNSPKSIPKLEEINFNLPPGTAITPIINPPQGPVLHNNNFSKVNQDSINPKTNPELRKTPERYPPYTMDKYWTNNAYINPTRVFKPAEASDPMNKDGLIQIGKFPSHPSYPILQNMMPQRSPGVYASPKMVPPQVVPPQVANMYLPNVESSTARVTSTVPNNSKQSKNTPRQKSQKGYTSRKKSSSKNDKSNNNAVTSTSRTNVTSIGTQVNQPINVPVPSCNPSNADNILSRVTNTQDGTIYPYVYSSIEKKPPLDYITQSSQSENISDNKAQLQGLIKTADNTHPPLLSPNKTKQNQISILRKKPKEKLKKPTTRKKKAATIVTSTSQVTREEANAMSTQSTDIPQSSSSSQPITSTIPGHISEMIYPNIPNSDLLKAFNNYWSAQVSHCAVCATFASCTSGSSRVMPPDWRYCQSTTLPESTPIWVREKIVNKILIRFFFV